MSEEVIREVNSLGTVRYSNKEGKLHRLNGPAIKCADGTKYWYMEGKRHRLDGPAVESTNGHKQWWLNGNLHRLDGPAVEYADGGKYWYIEGNEYTEKEWEDARCPSIETLKEMFKEVQS